MTHSRSGMDGEDIKAALRKSYGPLTFISQQLGVNKNAISSTIRDSRYSIPMEIRIAELLGKKPHEVWGNERFHYDGTPIERSSRKRPTRNIPAHLRHNGKAA